MCNCKYVHLNEYIVHPFSLQISVSIINAKFLFKWIVNSKIKILSLFEHTKKKDVLKNRFVLQ